MMEAADLALRNLTYRMFVELGRAPTADEVACEGHMTAGDLDEGWRRLADAHALVLEEGALALRMANPFSAVSTPHRVAAAGRWWHANCAWDAFGICAALGVDGHIETMCPDCGGSIAVEVPVVCPDGDTLLFHCLVPAAHWWDDIVFT